MFTMLAMMLQSKSAVITQPLSADGNQSVDRVNPKALYFVGMPVCLERLTNFLLLFSIKIILCCIVLVNVRPSLFRFATFSNGGGIAFSH